VLKAEAERVCHVSMCQKLRECAKDEKVFQKVEKVCKNVSKVEKAVKC
jgi:hypothetical protein